MARLPDGVSVRGPSPLHTQPVERFFVIQWGEKVTKLIRPDATTSEITRALHEAGIHGVQVAGADKGSKGFPRVDQAPPCDCDPKDLLSFGHRCGR